REDSRSVPGAGLCLPACDRWSCAGARGTYPASAECVFYGAIWCARGDLGIRGEELSGGGDDGFTRQFSAQRRFRCQPGGVGKVRVKSSEGRARLGCLIWRAAPPQSSLPSGFGLKLRIGSMNLKTDPSPLRRGEGGSVASRDLIEALPGGFMNSELE